MWFVVLMLIPQMLPRNIAVPPYETEQIMGDYLNKPLVTQIVMSTQDQIQLRLILDDHTQPPHRKTQQLVNHLHLKDTHHTGFYRYFTTQNNKTSTIATHQTEIDAIQHSSHRPPHQCYLLFPGIKVTWDDTHANPRAGEGFIVALIMCSHGPQMIACDDNGKTFPHSLPLAHVYLYNNQYTTFHNTTQAEFDNVRRLYDFSNKTQSNDSTKTKSVSDADVECAVELDRLQTENFTLKTELQQTRKDYNKQKELLRTKEKQLTQKTKELEKSTKTVTKLKKEIENLREQHEQEKEKEQEQKQQEHREQKYQKDQHQQQSYKRKRARFSDNDGDEDEDEERSYKSARQEFQPLRMSEVYLLGFILICSELLFSNS